VAPSRPATKGTGSREMVMGRCVPRRRWVSILTLPHTKQEIPMKHNRPGIPTPMANPYLALLERPVHVM